MRYTFDNPFIAHQCNEHGLEKAPIPTNIYESYAQCNEDLIVESLLRALTRRAGREMSSIRYIEIGANHPVQTSSTYLLHRVYDACGVLVEANPRLIEPLKRARPKDIVLNCAITAQPTERVDIHVHEKNELTSMSLDHIDQFQHFGGAGGVLETISIEAMGINQFLKMYFGDRVDFLAIDVEGFDLELVSAMDPVFRPSIIQCEHEHKFDAFAAALEPKGYRLAAVTDVNAIYVNGGLL